MHDGWRSENDGESIFDIGLNIRKERRGMIICGKRTSINLEIIIWESLEEIASIENISLINIINLLANRIDGANLHSALRVYAVSYFVTAAKEAKLAEILGGQLFAEIEAQDEEDAAFFAGAVNTTSSFQQAPTWGPDHVDLKYCEKSTS